MIKAKDLQEWFNTIFNKQEVNRTINITLTPMYEGYKADTPCGTKYITQEHGDKLIAKYNN